MSTHANFKVDPRLASLLGENYRSTELAIKELIDNAFDADAEHVWVSLPRPLSDDSIIIRDDGTGMTEQEVRNEYLNIASSRVSRKGDRTRLRNRIVKGRKGIGKFAGLMVASFMDLRTRTRGQETHLRIWREELIRARHDLEQIDLPISTAPFDPEESGTEVVLSGINQNFTFPSADRLKRLLVLEYGRMPDFQIYVNEELVDMEDIPGNTYDTDFSLSNGDTANLRYTISDGKHSLKQSGLAFRVGGKIVGNPQYFGLDEREDIPARLLRRVYGEIISDSLEADVTADWGSIIDNSKILEELREKIIPVLENALMEVYRQEIDASRIRLRRRINGNMERVPAYRQAQAQIVMDKVLKKFYGESETRQASVYSLLLDAFEKNDYWPIMQKLEASREETSDLTGIFSEFGMIDVALLSQQSTHRLTILRELEHLLQPKTSTNDIRTVLSNNLWMLGNAFSMVSTNPQLAQVIELYIGHKYTNGHAIEAPTLLLLQDFSKRFILLDLKPADHAIELFDRRKAKEFQDDLKVYLPGRDIEVIILGGALSEGMVDQRATATIKFLSYQGVISDARVQLNWLIGELNKRA
jgi:hypothetical protein